MRFSFVIPAFNEEARLGGTLDAIAAHLRGGFLEALGSAEVVVVDDGSTDDTAALVAARVAAFPVELRLLREPHRGKGGAVRAGMLAAAGDLRFLCDADGAMPCAEIDRFVEVAVSGSAVVIGSREGHGARRVDEPLYRHMLGRAFNGWVRCWAVRGITDTQCGYKLFTADAAQAIFSRLTILGFGFDVEALHIARRHGLAVTELPIEWHHRPTSKVRPVRDAFAMGWQVLRVRWNAMRGRYA